MGASHPHLNCWTGRGLWPPVGRGPHGGAATRLTGPLCPESPEGISSRQLALGVQEGRPPAPHHCTLPASKGPPPPTTERASRPALVFVVRGPLAGCRSDQRQEKSSQGQCSASLWAEPARGGPDLSKEVLTCSSQTVAPNHRPRGRSRPRGGPPAPQLPRNRSLAPPPRPARNQTGLTRSEAQRRTFRKRRVRRPGTSALRPLYHKQPNSKTLQVETSTSSPTSLAPPNFCNPPEPWMGRWLLDISSPLTWGIHLSKLASPPPGTALRRRVAVTPAGTAGVSVPRCTCPLVSCRWETQ